MNTNFIISLLILIIVGVSLSFYQYQYGNHWICSEDNRCSKKVFFGTFKNKSDCLSVCKSKNDKLSSSLIKETQIQETYQSPSEKIVINNFQSSRVGIPLQTPLVTPTNLPILSQIPTPSPQRPTPSPQRPTPSPQRPTPSPQRPTEIPSQPPRQSSMFQTTNTLSEAYVNMNLPSGVRNAKTSSFMIDNNTKNLNSNGYTNPDFNSIRPRYIPQVDQIELMKDNSTHKRANKVADTHIKIPEINKSVSLSNAGYSGLNLK